MDIARFEDTLVSKIWKCALREHSLELARLFMYTPLRKALKDLINGGTLTGRSLWETKGGPGERDSNSSGWEWTIVSRLVWEGEFNIEQGARDGRDQEGFWNAQPKTTVTGLCHLHLYMSSLPLMWWFLEIVYCHLRMTKNFQRSAGHGFCRTDCLHPIGAKDERMIWFKS